MFGTKSKPEADGKVVSIDETIPGRIYLPHNLSNPGFDIVEQFASIKEPLGIAHEVKYSDGDAAIIRGCLDVADKFINTLKRHPILFDDFCNNRFCFVYE